MAPSDTLTRINQFCPKKYQSFLSSKTSKNLIQIQKLQIKQIKRTTISNQEISFIGYLYFNEKRHHILGQKFGILAIVCYGPLRSKMFCLLLCELQVRTRQSRCIEVVNPYFQFMISRNHFRLVLNFTLQENTVSF